RKRPPGDRPRQYHVCAARPQFARHPRKSAHKSRTRLRKSGKVCPEQQRFGFPIKSSRYSRAADTDPQPLEAIKVSASFWIRGSVIEAGFLVLHAFLSARSEPKAQAGFFLFI